MKLQPIVYTADSAAAVEWYEKVLGKAPLFRSEMWSTFEFGEAYLAIHLVPETPDRGRVEVSLAAEEPLENIIARLADHGIAPEDGIQEQPFGRSFVVRDPDGSPIQINEHSA